MMSKILNMLIYLLSAMILLSAAVNGEYVSIIYVYISYPHNHTLTVVISKIR